MGLRCGPGWGSGGEGVPGVMRAPGPAGLPEMERVGMADVRRVGGKGRELKSLTELSFVFWDQRELS